MCYIGVHAGRLCKSGPLATLGSSQTQAQLWSRHTTESHRGRPACQSFGGCRAQEIEHAIVEQKRAGDVETARHVESEGQQGRSQT